MLKIGEKTADKRDAVRKGKLIAEYLDKFPEDTRLHKAWEKLKTIPPDQARKLKNVANTRKYVKWDTFGEIPLYPDIVDTWVQAEPDVMQEEEVFREPHLEVKQLEHRPRPQSSARSARPPPRLAPLPGLTPARPITPSSTPAAPLIGTAVPDRAPPASTPASPRTLPPVRTAASGPPPGSSKPDFSDQRNQAEYNAFVNSMITSITPPATPLQENKIEPVQRSLDFSSPGNPDAPPDLTGKFEGPAGKTWLDRLRKTNPFGGGYYNYCGPFTNFKGQEAVDATDAACKIHDAQYASLAAMKGKVSDEEFTRMEREADEQLLETMRQVKPESTTESLMNKLATRALQLKMFGEDKGVLKPGQFITASETLENPDKPGEKIDSDVASAQIQRLLATYQGYLGTIKSTATSDEEARKTIQHYQQMFQTDLEAILGKSDLGFTDEQKEQARQKFKDATTTQTDNFWADYTNKQSRQPVPAIMPPKKKFSQTKEQRVLSDFAADAARYEEEYDDAINDGMPEERARAEFEDKIDANARQFHNYLMTTIGLPAKEAQKITDIATTSARHEFAKSIEAKNFQEVDANKIQVVDDDQPDGTSATPTKRQIGSSADTTGDTTTSNRTSNSPYVLDETNRILVDDDDDGRDGLGGLDPGGIQPDWLMPAGDGPGEDGRGAIVPYGGGGPGGGPGGGGGGGGGGGPGDGGPPPNAGGMMGRQIERIVQDPVVGDVAVGGAYNTRANNDVLRLDNAIEADPWKTVPSELAQIRSDIEFDMFSVVRPGFGLGVDNKMFVLENAREDFIVHQKPEFLPRPYDGPGSGVDTVPLSLQNVLPSDVFKAHAARTQRLALAAQLTATETKKGSLNILGDDYGQLDSISDRGLNRPPESFLEPVIRIDSRWSRVKPEPGYLSSKRQFRKLYDSLRYPEHMTAHMNLDGGPVLKKNRASLQVMM